MNTVPLICCIVAGAIVGYLLGSVNFAIIISKLFGINDIRDSGSGNAGMTNVLRVAGKLPAFLTLLGDFLKGIVSVIFVRLLLLLIVGYDVIFADYIVAFAALLGHVFPIFYGFKGGKGILVSAGAMLILSPWSLLICLTAFLIFTASTRYVSLGSIVAGIVFPIANILVTFLEYGAVQWLEVLYALPIGLFVIFMHRANIHRLVTGTENKISFHSKKED